MDRIRILLAVTGASGSVYGQSLLKAIRKLGGQAELSGVVLSETAKQVWKYELGEDPIKSIPEWQHPNDDFWAPFASGSSAPDVMIIAPCSMGALGRIASGVANELITRAADVVLKERKKLILLTREAPLNLIHIRNMQTVTEAGGIICPASPSFYSKPQSMDELIQTVTERVLDLAGISHDPYRWTGK